MIEKNTDNLKILLGFDNAGELFQVNEKVLRGIYPEYELLYRNILEKCEKDNLFRYGIIKTVEQKEPVVYQEHKFNFILEHERILFITYPHEWSASMLKDAAIFHIDLFMQLEKFGLTLKDWHPYNILFKNTDPVFVDFLSIIPVDDLEKQDYLNPPYYRPYIFFERFWNTRSRYLFEMYRRMYIPYFLLPILIMAQKKYKLARKRIYQTVLNANRTPLLTPSEVFNKNKIQRIFFEINEILKKISLIDASSDKQKYFKKLRTELEYNNVKPPSSAYVEYYDLKNENFDFNTTTEWTEKQLVVYNTIQKLKPITVMDIASNTGWFSILAAYLGSSVVSVDIDESCIDRLYEYAKKEDLSILPLVMDITDLSEEVYPIDQKDQLYKNRMKNATPLLRSVESRLQCDMVLVLALVHHLVLGQNMNFNIIRKILDPLTKKYLIIEFVAKNDNLIIENPDFFPALKANPNTFNWYTVENLIIELKLVFNTIEIVDSYPKTRKLLICKK